MWSTYCGAAGATRKPVEQESTSIVERGEPPFLAWMSGKNQVSSALHQADRPRSMSRFQQANRGLRKAERLM